MRIAHYFDEISLAPFFGEFKGYRLGSLRDDLLAGLSVALLTLPQSIAYALVAGLPLSSGVLSAIFSCMIASLFSSSRHLVIGPSNAIAILIQVGTSELLYQYYRGLMGAERELVALQITTQIAFLVAVMHLLVAGCKLGRLTQFVSYSVVIGYVLGAIFAIVTGQLYTFLGISPLQGVYPLYVRAWYLLTHLNESHLLTLAIGAASFILLVVCKRLRPKFPAALFTFTLVTSLFVLCRNYFEGPFLAVETLDGTGVIDTLLPVLSPPHFNFAIVGSLLSISFAIALLSILETSAVAKTLASYTGEPVVVNQEILGMGLGNLLSSFIGALPISGSSSRSMLNWESGAKTRLSVLFGAAFVGLILHLFGSWVMQVPLACMAALLLVTSGNLIRKKNLLLCLKSTRSDAFVLGVTFFSSIFFGIDIAFYVGVVLSVTLYLHKAAVPQVLQYSVDSEGKLRAYDDQSARASKIRFIKVKGELFFGAADLFEATFKSIAKDDGTTLVIILQLKNARDIDATSCLAIRQLHDFVRSTNRFLLISGIPLSLWEILSDSGLVASIGKENLFLIEERYPNRYFQRALERAGELVALHSAQVDAAVVQQPADEQLLSEAKGETLELAGSQT